MQEAADACTADPTCTAFNLDPYSGHWCLKTKPSITRRKDAPGVCFYTKRANFVIGRDREGAVVSRVVVALIFVSIAPSSIAPDSN